MIIPLIQAIPYQSPIQVMAFLKNLTGVVLLDSAELRPYCGRYSYIAIDPFYTLKNKNQLTEIDGKAYTENPFDVLKQYLDQFKLESQPGYPPFQGGVVGYFSYDLYQHLEKIPLHKIDDMHYPDMMIGFYDLVIAFDLEVKKAWICSSGFPLKDPHEREIRAQKRIDWLLSKIKNNPALSHDNAPILKEEDIISNVTQAHYHDAVKKVVDYIRDGDIFEACISQRFKAILPKELSAFDLYCRLRFLNPAPFSAYMNFEEITIISASPERFIQLHNGQVETRPIKGTRPRGKNPQEDQQLANELTNSAKDHAENVMIVDLLRNDLSRVCESHSVNVTQLCGLESYATVHHLVSVVTGKLNSTLTAVDLLKATFPGGSITGAPKIRAMEIIAEIEKTQRGPYCGSLAYIGFNGNMDSSILIRTYCIKDNTITFQAGGAVVIDSDPEMEYQETLIKAAALRKALV